MISAAAATHVALSVRVMTVRSSNPKGFGGCIFTGRPINDQGDIIDARSIYVVRVPYTVVFNTSVEVGQWWKICGEFIQQTRVINGYSICERQIEASDASLIKPSGEHIITLLAESESFIGIGYVKARKLWNTFGEHLYALLDDRNVAELGSVLTGQSAQQVVDAWGTYGNSRIMQWLHKHGFNVRLGRSVWEFFGSNAESEIESDPYRLLSFCGNWQRVDQFARSEFKVTANDMRRLQGAVEEALYRIFALGHTAATMATLQSHLHALLGEQTRDCQWKELISEAIDSGLDNGSYVIGGTGLIHPLGPMVMEMTVASAIAARLQQQATSALMSAQSLSDVIADYEHTTSFSLTQEQKTAIKLANDNPFTVIIGGAGVGKTTVLDALHRIYQAAGLRVYQMALAGRAARRMSEATQRPASTIASFLKNTAVEDLNGPSVVIVDEASMVDVVTMSRLCEFLPPHVRLLLTGDASQLMPVGPGLILHVLVEMPNIPKVELTAVKRFGGAIANAAQQIRNGIWPQFGSNFNASISFVPGEMTEIAGIVYRLYADHPQDSQIISARRGGHDGTKAINALCQSQIGANAKLLMVWNNDYNMPENTGLRLDDPVICTRNRWDIGIQNGSLGRLKHIEEPPLEVKNENGDVVGQSIAKILWDDGIERPVFEDLLDDIELGYAITVHKSQGSQWSRVIVPLSKNRLLDRTLIYTAITRARTQVIVVGDQHAAQCAVEAPPKAKLRVVALGSILSTVMADTKK